MKRYTVTVTLTDHEVSEGWAGIDAEVVASIEATLHELNADNGQVYVPSVHGEVGA